VNVSPAPRVSSTFQHTCHSVGHALFGTFATKDRFALSEEPRDISNEGYVAAPPLPPDLNRQPKEPANQRFNLSRSGCHLTDFRADQTDVCLFRELGEKRRIPFGLQALKPLQCLEHLISHLGRVAHPTLLQWISCVKKWRV
jgi:hypothetical protein